MNPPPVARQAPSTSSEATANPAAPNRRPRRRRGDPLTIDSDMSSPRSVRTVLTPHRLTCPCQVVADQKLPTTRPANHLVDQKRLTARRGCSTGRIGWVVALQAALAA